MRNSPRKRSLLVATAATLIALGMLSRHPAMPEFCVHYVGDVLWGAFFFVLAAVARPSATAIHLWLASTGVTELIEVSQLYQAPWAQALRSTSFGGLLLGHSFSWSDTLCVALGTTAAAWLDAACSA